MLSIFRVSIGAFLPGKSGALKKAFVPVLFTNMSTQSAAAPALPQLLSKNMNFFTSEQKTKHSNNNNKHRPLAVILNWMLAKRRHVMKFGDFYRDQGFDVLAVNLSPLQLLWPTTGAQVVADDILKFLLKNSNYESIVVHGFSVGGYLYGEMLIKMQQNPEKYGKIAERIVGQVFDSAVDYNNIPNGLSKAITNNRSLQKWLQAYIRYHMRLFHESSTKYYLRSSDVFHNNLVRCPSLFFFSRDDPVGTAEGNMRVINKWEANGVKVFVRCWDSSPHVGHMYHHPEEY